MKQYEKYKSSGVEWVGEIPSHWELKRLKYVAMVQPSNVDKKTNEGEASVLLCNYMDVYKNEFIDDSISFMEATATENEIEKFKLEKGDVLVTKDSETPDDIANPACVKSDFENVICAYHLTQIRPDRKKLLGEYLFRLFQENKFKAQFEVAANGVTRYGLSVAAFTDAYVPLPSIEEQTTIANFLDEKTTQIDKLISNKQKLIELLKEERTAVINEAVSGKGKNWEKKKLRYLCKITTGAKNTEDRIEDGEYPFYVRSQTVERINSFSFDGEGILTAGDGVGVAKVFHYVNGKIDFHQRVYLFYDFSNEISAKYLFHFIQMNLIYEVLKHNAKSTVDSLRLPMLKDFPITFPSSKTEQNSIVEYIKTETERISNIISKTETEIELMNEYRTALISEVVTGKIKVTDNG